ncbi:EAL domain-containing protein, partial [Desertibaculum subflavum]|uniref:EAL domain-containing protein n=1 Tax=Desertibaculum subflavum TaxID=2268458 RepID=UPI0013C47167
MAFAFSAADLLIEVGGDGRIQFATGAGAGVVRRPVDELVGAPWLDLIHPRDRRMVDLLTAGLQAGQRRGPIAVRLRIGGQRKDDPAVHAALTIYRMPTEGAALHCTLSAVKRPMRVDSSEDKRDPESDILNKDGLLAAANRLLNDPSVAKDETTLTLLDLIDVEKFAPGLPKGDREELIKSVGATLRANSIDGDGAGRFARSKFGVLHEKAINVDQLRNAVTDVIKGFDPAADGNVIKASTIDLGGDNLSSAEAMNAMVYAVNHFTAAAPGELPPASLAEALEEMVGETVKRVYSFKEVLGEERFTFAFQPIVAMKDRSVHHYEVLARFQDGRPAFETIRFAEAIGMVEQFDLAVLRRSMAILDERIAEPELRLAVNLSGRSIQNDIFVKVLLGLLDRGRILAQRLSLEITESAEIADLEKIDRVLQEIRGRGFAVCIDDFGSGSASIRYLSGLSVDFLKIDGSYVQRITHSRRDYALLKSLAQLCRDLDIGTIAEMVETEAQDKSLREIGISLGQGWLYGKPGPLVPPQPAPAAARAAPPAAQPARAAR